MFKMGSQDPFGRLKHKLWPNEEPGIKLSNNKFDSQSLKVKNLPDFLMCRWHVAYCWKALNEGYDFVLDLISIESLHTKLWAFKVVRVPILGILGLQLGSPETK